MTIKEWNKQYKGMPSSHKDYMQGYIGFVMYNDAMGQNIVFKSPADVVETIKHSDLYNVRDRYIYFDGENIIGFNSNDDVGAPWNYMYL